MKADAKATMKASMKGRGGGGKGRGQEGEETEEAADEADERRRRRQAGGGSQTRGMDEKHVLQAEECATSGEEKKHPPNSYHT